MLSIDNGFRRCIFMHAWYTHPDSRSKAPFFLRWILFPIIGSKLDDKHKAEEFLKTQSDINFSVISPSGLSNGQATNCDFFAKEDSFYVEENGGMIPRADVARYMIKTMEDNLHHKKIVAISPKK